MKFHITAKKEILLEIEAKSHEDAERKAALQAEDGNFGADAEWDIGPAEEALQECEGCSREPGYHVFQGVRCKVESQSGGSKEMSLCPTCQQNLRNMNRRVTPIGVTP